MGLLKDRLDQLSLIFKNIEINPSNMDPNGNQWQQDNRTRIDAIKQEIANLKRQLERNGNNLSEYQKAALRNDIRQKEADLQTLRYGDAMRGAACMKNLYKK